MPKTTIPRNTVIDICHYFEFLKNTYDIKNVKLEEVADLDKKTVSCYTSEKPLKSLPTEDTITKLLDGFKKILAQKDCPYELSLDFLYSPRLHEFLENLEKTKDSITSTADSQYITEETPVVLNRNPMLNKTLISYLVTILFGFGGSVILTTTILGNFFSKTYLFKTLVIGVFCLSVAFTLTLPYLKQPLEISPQSRYLYSHVKIANFLAYFSQIAILILSVLLPPISCLLLLLLFL